MEEMSGRVITFKAFVQATSHLEELIKVRPAIQDSLKRIIVSQLQEETVSGGENQQYKQVFGSLFV